MLMCPTCGDRVDLPGLHDSTQVQQSLLVLTCWKHGGDSVDSEVSTEGQVYVLTSQASLTSQPGSQVIEWCWKWGLLKPGPLPKVGVA